MTLDNPVALLMMILVLLLLVALGAISSLGLISAYVPGLRAWVEEQVARLRGRRE